MATKKALIKEIISLKLKKEEIDKELEDRKKDLFDIFDAEGGDGPTFMEYYPEGLESLTDITEYWNFKNPGAKLNKIDEKNRIMYGYYPKGLQKSICEEEGYGKIERRISYPTPKVDLIKLKRYHPDLFEKVTTNVPEFDDEKFGRLLESGEIDDSTFQPFIQGVSPRVSFHVIPEKDV